MILRALATVLAVFVAVGMGSVPADAQTSKKKQAISARGNTVYSSRDEDGRRRTRIIVQRRSYLDPGTEVFPGERRYNTNGIYLPTYSGYGPIENTPFYHRGPLPGPFDLPSRNNPGQW